jgi:hypothetical protein
MRNVLTVRSVARAALLAAVATGATLATPAPTWAGSADHTPASIPTNVRQVGAGLSSSIAWDASVDDSGSIAYYRVTNRDIGTYAFPRQTSVSLLGLLSAYCDLPKGSIPVTVEAVDAAGNISFPSAPVDIRID